MTYTLFECLKDRLEEIMTDIDMAEVQENALLGIGKDEEAVVSDKNKNSYYDGMLPVLPGVRFSP